MRSSSLRAVTCGLIQLNLDSGHAEWSLGHYSTTTEVPSEETSVPSIKCRDLGGPVS